MSHYNDAVERYTKMYTEEFQKHVLDRVNLDPAIFHMHRPDRGLYHTHICFIGGKIVIFGDAMIGHLGRGVISTPGYDLDWFTSQLDAGYLAEKFLGRDWCEECARDFVDEELQEENMGTEVREYGLKWIKDGDEWSRDVFIQEWIEHMNDTEDWPRMGYNPAEISMLHVIQVRFRELHKEM